MLHYRMRDNTLVTSNYEKQSSEAPEIVIEVVDI